MIGIEIFLKNFLRFILVLFFTIIIFTGCFQIYAFFRLGKIFLKLELLILKRFAEGAGFESMCSNWRSVYQYYQKDSFYPFIFIGAGSLVSSFLIVFYKRAHLKKLSSKVIRGPQLVSAPELNRRFKRLAHQEFKEIYKDLSFFERRKMSKRSFVRGLLGNRFRCSVRAFVDIPEFVLSRHLSFLGSTGVGKSTLIKHYLQYTNSIGEKSLILDFNGELFSEMGRKGDVILGLFDKRSKGWDFCHERSGKKMISPMEYAKYLVPKGSDANSFWWKGARTALAEIIENYPSAKELWIALNDPSRDFMDNLSGVIHNIIGKVGSSQDAGIIGTLSSDLGFLKYLNALNERSGDFFSVIKWAQDRSSKNVFIVVADSDLETASPLIRTWINLAILGRFEAAKNKDLPKLNIIIDELGSFGRIEQLPNALARLRKYRGKVILGMQSEGQLQGIYGKEDSTAIKGNIGSKFIFRTPEENEARDLSRFLGKSEVIKVSKGSGKSKDGKITQSQNESISYKNIVLDSEIRSLVDGHFYLKSLNLPPAKLRIKKKRWKQVNLLHCEQYVRAVAEKSLKTREATVREANVNGRSQESRSDSAKAITIEDQKTINPEINNGFY